jgi:diguanylate cyclase (GGDEF)-like protein
MFANGKRTVGVFISQLNDEFQDNLCKGITSRAKELDYNVAFFTNFGGYGQLEFDLGEREIARLPYYQDFDGIILAPDTFTIDKLNNNIKRFIEKYSHCPIVSVRRKMEGYHNVLIEDDNILEEVITHLIEDHDFTRLNFLAGPKDSIASEKRLLTYQRVLAKHNIPVEEDRIYYGDFWKRAGYDAVRHWLNGSLERPQAIVCANDYMAITVCNALEENGISVPEDMVVTGCDDVEDASRFVPSLTTVTIPVYEIGVEAVNLVHQKQEDNSIPEDSYIKTTTQYRESCGCRRDWYKESSEQRKHCIALFDSMKREIARNARMTTALTGLTKLEEVINNLKAYIMDKTELKNFLLCLRADWDTNHFFGSNEMVMEFGINNRTEYRKINFSRRDLIPKEFAEEQPMIYYFAMLHHLDKNFGYIAISYEKLQTYMITFQNWLINIGNALENIRIHRELNRLIYTLEDMSYKDDLTDLYNRRAIETLGQKYLKQCMQKQVGFMVLTIDMDNLKYINDTFGHAQGDVALRAIGMAISAAAEDDEICIRYGGDEFMAIGMDYDAQKLDTFLKRFKEELDLFNHSGENKYKVQVSYGWNMLIPDSQTTLEDCLILSDQRMYRQKSERKG